MWLLKVVQTGLCKGKLIQGQIYPVLSMHEQLPCARLRQRGCLRSEPSHHGPGTVQESQRAPCNWDGISAVQRAGLSGEGGVAHIFLWDRDTRRDLELTH